MTSLRITITLDVELVETAAAPQQPEPAPQPVPVPEPPARASTMPSDEELTERFAANLRAAIEKSERSIVSIGEEAGIGRNSLYRKLAGTSPIYVGELLALAHALGVTAESLLADERNQGAA